MNTFELRDNLRYYNQRFSEMPVGDPMSGACYGEYLKSKALGAIIGVVAAVAAVWTGGATLAAYAAAGSTVSIAARGRDDDVFVCVVDRGPGIGGPAHDRFLAPRVDLPHEKPTTSGHGIGLTIAACLVQSMGGKLWYEEHTAGECRFCFSLPLGPALDGDAVS